MLGGDPHGGVALPADPKRQRCTLRWLRVHADLGDLHEAALIGKGRLRPGESQHVDRLLEAGPAMVGRMSESLALLEKPASADAQLAASLRKKVDRRSLFRQRGRICGDERPGRNAADRKST